MEQTEKKNKLFIVLGFIFLTNAIIAEFIGAKIFSLEVSLGLDGANINLLGSTFNFDMTAGVILWPFVFILTDIINEYYGRNGVRKLSYLTVIMLIYSFVMVRIAMNLEGAEFWKKSSEGKGIQNMGNAFDSVFGQGLWIILGSLVAFLIGQLVDSYIYSKLKDKTGDQLIWIRATGSTVVSQFIDSYVVLIIAFYIGGSYSFIWVLQVGTINYLYKLFMAVILLPLLIGIHKIIDNYLGLNHKVTQTT